MNPRVQYRAQIKKVPFEETDFVGYPISLYEVAKKFNELMS